MIKDEELIEMIHDAATEQLPITMMTFKDMRQFAQKVAMECALISAIPARTPQRHHPLNQGAL